MGVVIYDPEDQGSRWRHLSKATIDVPCEVLASWKPRKQQIGPAESIVGLYAAAIGAILLSTHALTSSQFRGWQVIHFIDNVGPLCGMHKGYTHASRDLDSARHVGRSISRTAIILSTGGNMSHSRQLGMDPASLSASEGDARMRQRVPRALDPRPD